MVKLPDSIDDDAAAAAMMLQGMTARYLLRETFRCTPDTVLLFHAAAGGVGLMVCQWAKAIGATMIGTVGSDEKAQLALAAGCTHVVNYRTEDYVALVRELTGGRGCDVVYDGVRQGYLSFIPRLPEAAGPMGQLWKRVRPGAALRHADPFRQGVAVRHTADDHDLYGAAGGSAPANAAELFGVVASGVVKIAPSRTYPLREAAQAHRDLEARKTTGSVVLVP